MRSRSGWIAWLVLVSVALGACGSVPTEPTAEVRPADAPADAADETTGSDRAPRAGGAKKPGSRGEDPFEASSGLPTGKSVVGSSSPTESAEAGEPAVAADAPGSSEPSGTDDDRPADAPPSGWDYPKRFEANAFVIETSEHEPELCFGAIADSYPPQCRGIPAVGWDWDDVQGEERHNGTVWGSFRVVGVYDGDDFTIEDAGKAQRRLDSGPRYGPIRSACGERDPADRDRWTERRLQRAARYANGARDVAGLWVEYLQDSRPNDEPENPSEVVLNVAFTGRLDHHETRLREIWGGPLCVVRFEHSRRYLSRVQRDLHDSADRLDLEVLASGIDEVGNEVELEVVWIDEARRRYIARRYGRGVVSVYTALHPLRWGPGPGSSRVSGSLGSIG